MFNHSTLMNYISMSQKELNKYEVIQRSIKKDITAEKAGELLNLSLRQVYRLRSRVKTQGTRGLTHGNRGKSSNRKIPEKERRKLVNLLHKCYSDFRPTHAAEKLRVNHGIRRDSKTIRLIMVAEDLWKPRKEKKTDYRSSRPRKEHYGEMEQFDGSYEYWFEARSPRCCLLASIDDATGCITQAKFVSDEGVFPVFGFWQEYLLGHGKPRSIYSDKLRTYYNNHPSAEENDEMLTQFQRAMRALSIEPIVAHSPQAKGRIERLFNTLQDRLIKEMRLRNISGMETANQFLKDEFLPWFNARYSVEPKRKANLHRTLTREEKKQLPAILSRQSERTVLNDFTFRFNHNWYQLLRDQPATVRAREKVSIEERLDNSIWIRLRNKYLNYQVLPAKPERGNEQPWIIAANQKNQKKERKPYKPSKDHPWRKYPFILSSPAREQEKVAF